jgi:hypothetical protein
VTRRQVTLLIDGGWCVSNSWKPPSGSIIEATMESGGACRPFGSFVDARMAIFKTSIGAA